MEVLWGDFFSLNVPGGSFIIFSSHDDDVKNMMCVFEIVYKSVCVCVSEGGCVGLRERVCVSVYE